MMPGWLIFVDGDLVAKGNPSVYRSCGCAWVWVEPGSVMDHVSVDLEVVVKCLAFPGAGGVAVRVAEEFFAYRVLLPYFILNLAMQIEDHAVFKGIGYHSFRLTNCVRMCDISSTGESGYEMSEKVCVRFFYIFMVKLHKHGLESFYDHYQVAVCREGRRFVAVAGTGAPGICLY